MGKCKRGSNCNYLHSQGLNHIVAGAEAEGGAEARAAPGGCQQGGASTTILPARAPAAHPT